jgi:hypothetical protein
LSRTGRGWIGDRSAYVGVDAALRAGCGDYSVTWVMT